MIRLLAIALVLFLLAGCSTVPKSFMPADPISPTAFSHELFDRVVRTYVQDGRVDYSGIRGDAGFETYVRQLDRVDPNGLPTRADQLAFWINAYNAYAIKGILDGLSPRTFWGRYRYFIARDYRVGGETINLYDLEREVLIAHFREPRMHFAIVCASSSCPKLQPWVYRGDQLEAQLDRVAREFINDETRNRFDRENKVAYLSMIFKWFEEDFVAHSESVINYVRQYVSDRALARDLDATRYRVEFLEYDWSLNGQPPGEVSRAGTNERTRADRQVAWLHRTWRAAGT